MVESCCVCHTLSSFGYSGKARSTKQLHPYFMTIEQHIEKCFNAISQAECCLELIGKEIKNGDKVYLLSKAKELDRNIMSAANSSQAIVNQLVGLRDPNK